jgi:hypothetical protein
VREEFCAEEVEVSAGAGCGTEGSGAVDGNDVAAGDSVEPVAPLTPVEPVVPAVSADPFTTAPEHPASTAIIPIVTTKPAIVRISPMLHTITTPRIRPARSPLTPTPRGKNYMISDS